MARGNKNKRDASRRGGSNQAFRKSDNHQQSNRNKRQTAGWASGPQDQSLISEIARSGNSRTKEQTRSSNTNEQRFNLLVDNVPYMVKATPFEFNGEIRYRVSVNEGSEHVFTWDSTLGQLRAIDDDASTLPVNAEEAISEKLQSKA